MRLASLLLVLAACPAPAARSTKPVATDPLAARLDAATAPYVATNNFTGVIRVSRHGTLPFEAMWKRVFEEFATLCS